MKKKIIIAIVIIAVLAAFITFAVRNIQNSEKQSGIPRDAYPVELQEAKTDTIITKVSVNGVVEMVDKTTMYPKSDAIATKVYVKAGDTVTEGDLILKYSDEALETYQNQIDDLNLQLRSARLRLAEISLPPGDMDILTAERTVSQSEKDIRDLNSKIAQADSVIAQLEDDLATAGKKRDDAQTLLDAGIISKNEFEAYTDAVSKIEIEIRNRISDKDSLLLTMDSLNEALDFNIKKYDTVVNRSGDESVKNQISQSKIAIEQIELKIEQLQKQIDDFIYEETASTSGTLMSLYAADGSYVSRNAPIAEIADTGYRNLRIVVNVPESDASEIKTGQNVEITGNILGKDKISGKIVKINPIAEQKQLGNSMETVIGVEISFSDDTGKLRSGNTVTADIITKISDNIVVVPLMSTFSESDGKEYVYIMNDDFTVSKREISLIAYSGMYVGVTNVSQGEKVVASPSPQIKDGSYVKPVVRNNGGE